jgi:hypothetical protein
MPPIEPAAQHSGVKECIDKINEIIERVNALFAKPVPPKAKPKA